MTLSEIARESAIICDHLSLNRYVEDISILFRFAGAIAPSHGAHHTHDSTRVSIASEKDAIQSKYERRPSLERLHRELLLAYAGLLRREEMITLRDACAHLARAMDHRQ